MAGGLVGSRTSGGLRRPWLNNWCWYIGRAAKRHSPTKTVPNPFSRPLRLAALLSLRPPSRLCARCCEWSATPGNLPLSTDRWHSLSSHHSLLASSHLLCQSTKTNGKNKSSKQMKEALNHGRKLIRNWRCSPRPKKLAVVITTQ